MPAGRRDRRAATVQAIGQLLAETGDDLIACAVVERQQQDDEPAGGEAAELSVALDEDDLRAFARRRDGGGDAGAPAAHDEYLSLREYRRIARRLVDGAHACLRGAAARIGGAQLGGSKPWRARRAKVRLASR